MVRNIAVCNKKILNRLDDFALLDLLSGELPPHFNVGLVGPGQAHPVDLVKVELGILVVVLLQVPVDQLACCMHFRNELGSKCF